MEIAVGVFSSRSDVPMISNFGSGRASSRDRKRRMHVLVVEKNNGMTSMLTVFVHVLGFYSGFILVKPVAAGGRSCGRVGTTPMDLSHARVFPVP